MMALNIEERMRRPPGLLRLRSSVNGMRRQLHQSIRRPPGGVTRTGWRCHDASIHPGHHPPQNNQDGFFHEVTKVGWVGEVGGGLGG